jgi:geranylgeranyl reductase family protein
MIEKKSLPRYKACGGGIVYRARKLLPPAVQTSFEKEYHIACLSFQDANLHFKVKRNEPILTMVMRDKLDNTLTDLAGRAGVRILENCELKGLENKAEEVQVKAGDRVFRAKFLIGADGVFSRVAKKSGWPETRRLAPALEGEVYCEDALNQVPRFDFGSVPGGYAWIFPKADHLSIGVMTTKAEGINLNREFENYLKRIGIKPPISKSVFGHAIPMRPRTDGFVKNRVILSGDAAGLADPVTAEGITNAIISGRLAAQAVIHGKASKEKIKGLYEYGLGSHITKELKVGRILAGIIYRYPGLRTMLFKRYGQKFSEAVTDVIMGDRKYSAEVLNPLNYLRLLGFRLSGK